MISEIKSLRAGLKSAIDAYLIAFEKKYDGYFDEESLPFEPRYFGDYVFSIDEIILDIENANQKGEIFKWRGACVDHGCTEINFRSWLMGARFK